MDAKDHQEIRQLFDDYLQMYASRDDQLTEHFSDDFSGFTGGGDFLVKSREEWIAITRQDFAQVKEPLRIELKDLAIQSLSDSIAVTTGFFNIHLPIEDHILSRETARLVLIFRKESRGWKISHSSISIPYHLVREGEVYPLQGLVEQNRLLEEQIAERTRQLFEANEKLHLTNEALAREIEEHKATETAHARLLLQQRAILDNLPMMAWLKDCESRLEMVNEPFAKVCGLSVDECIGKTDLDLFPEEMAKEFIADDHKMCATGQRKQVEEQISMPDGLKWHLTHKAPLFDEQGRVTGTVGITLDINDLKEAQQQLDERNRLFDTLLANLPVGVFMVEAPSGRALVANAKALELLGRDVLPDTNKQNLTEVYESYRYGTGERYPIEEMPIVRGMYGEVTTVDDLQLVRPDGTAKLLAISGTPVLDTNGHPWASLVCVQDITESKEQANEKLKLQKLESLGVLAGGIAHDFNNILTGIIGNISLAKMFVDDTHKSYNPLLDAEKASLRATDLARQLLTFAKGGEPVKKVFSIQNLVNECVALVLHGSNVKSFVDIPNSIHAIEADEGQISQALHNIIINATQAMPGGGVLTLSAQIETLSVHNNMALSPGTYVRLECSDEGCGISETDLRKIFDPYFTTKVSGTGLGLASTHSIITKHGGHISVSSSVGKGTTFTIYLPSIGETFPEYQAETVAQTQGAHNGGSILVMDDEEMILGITSAMLEEIGFDAKTCKDGSDAIRCYKEAKASDAPFIAVILDLTIPGGLGGKEAAKEILALDPSACLIVSSGYSNDPIMSDYRTYGFSGAIGKPYRISELAQVLRDTGLMGP
jgi:PAS domain S-box-containing protein